MHVSCFILLCYISLATKVFSALAISLTHHVSLSLSLSSFFSLFLFLSSPSPPLPASLLINPCFFYYPLLPSCPLDIFVTYIYFIVSGGVYRYCIYHLLVCFVLYFFLPLYFVLLSSLHLLCPGAMTHLTEQVQSYSSSDSSLQFKPTNVSSDNTWFAINIRPPWSLESL